MTRETKIGLLVGLAFIIVIGILLSDHLTTSTEPPPARLAQAGPSVRGGIAIPGADNTPAPVVVPPVQVAPSKPVPTPGDLAEAAARANAQAQQEALARQQAAEQAAAAQSSPIIVASNVSDAAVTQSPALPSHRAELAATARQQGETLIPVQTLASPSSAVPSAPTQLVPAGADHRTYTAVAGDTLSGLAEKLLGHNTKANRQALIAANPSLKENPDLIIAGKTYNVPEGQVVKAVSQSVNQPATSTGQASGRWYTVKDGDSLWRIAVDQTGSAGNLDRIRQLNQQSLRGRDVVRVGMKLRLPAGG